MAVWVWCRTRWLNGGRMHCCAEITLGTKVAPTQPHDDVDRRLLVDVVVRQGASVLELLAAKDEPLLIGWDALAVLDECLDTGHGVPFRVDVERQVSPSQCL